MNIYDQINSQNYWLLFSPFSVPYPATLSRYCILSFSTSLFSSWWLNYHLNKLSSVIKPQFQLLFCMEACFLLRRSLMCPLQSRACSSKSHQAYPFHDQIPPQYDIFCEVILDTKYVYFWDSFCLFCLIVPFRLTKEVVSSNTEKIMIQC